MDQSSRCSLGSSGSKVGGLLAEQPSICQASKLEWRVIDLVSDALMMNLAPVCWAIGIWDMLGRRCWTLCVFYRCPCSWGGCLGPSSCSDLELEMMHEAMSFSFFEGCRCYWEGSDDRHLRKSGFELVHKFRYILQSQGSAAKQGCDSWLWRSAFGRSRSRRTWILVVALDISSWTGRLASNLAWYGVSDQASLHLVVFWGSWCMRKSSMGVSQTKRGSSLWCAAGFRDSAIACCIAAGLHSSGIWPSPRIRMAKGNGLDL